MVEDTVEQQPYASFPAGSNQGVEVGVITQARIDLKEIDRVVAVTGRGEDRAEQQPVSAPRNEMVEPPLQPRQPVYLDLERAQLLLGSKEAEGVDLPPDNVVNPRHLLSSSPGDGIESSPDSHLLRWA